VKIISSNIKAGIFKFNHQDAKIFLDCLLLK